MIIDAHTHIFPRAVVEARERYLDDPNFAGLYADPASKLADADMLIASMDTAEIDVSVALGFAWTTSDRCAEGNDALLDAAARYPNRVIPFANVWPGDPDVAYREAERCAQAGCRGLGELRPGGAGPACPAYAIDGGPAGEALAAAASDFDLALLFHVSEPVGHTYPGKAGLRMEELLAFVGRYPDVRVIAAHWGGGLPFFSLMPEVREALASTWFDTAATSLLYTSDVFAAGTQLVGADRLLFGSDFPLLSQKRQRTLVERATGLTERDRAALLGENAARLFGVEEVR